MKKNTTISALLFAVSIFIASCGGGGGGGGGSINKANSDCTPTLIGGTMQGCDLGMTDSTTVTVTTYAGSGAAGVTDTIGIAAEFKIPFGVTTDGENLFVSDQNNHTIRMIDIATAEVTTLAGLAGVSGTLDGVGTAARFKDPWGVTTDGTSVFVADEGNETIRQVNIATGTVTTLAGEANSVSHVDGTGSVARFVKPRGITTDGVNLYVSEFASHTIRKVVISTGVVTTIAGSVDTSGTLDGTGTDALFKSPTGVVTDGTNLYVTDGNNYTIRKIDLSTYEVTTLAGQAGVYGGDDGIGTDATFGAPYNITTDGVNLYVTDIGSTLVRKINIATAEVTTIAGVYDSFGYNDGAGNTALFEESAGLTTDGVNLYLCDSSGYRIRKIEPSDCTPTLIGGAMQGCDLGMNDSSAVYVSTFAGDGTEAVTNDTGVLAQFYDPKGITTDGVSLFVTDQKNSANTIRKIDIETAEVTTLAGIVGAGDYLDGDSATARFNVPQGITTDGTSVFVVELFNHVVRQIDIETGWVSTLAGKGENPGIADGSSENTRFKYPVGITTDGEYIFVSEWDTNTIRQVVIATGATTTLAGQAGTSGTSDGTGDEARFNNPMDLTTQGGNLYVADRENNLIRKIVVTSGVVTTFAGSGEAGWADGVGVDATFNKPISITTDGVYLYVGGFNSASVRKINIATQEVTTIAGVKGQKGNDDGAGNVAKFNVPYGITTDGTDLYVTELYNDLIRKISP